MCQDLLYLVPYGGMATHSQEKPGNEFFLHVDPTVENEDEPEFELSNCKFFSSLLYQKLNAST